MRMETENPFRIVTAKAEHVQFISSFGRRSFIDAYKSTLPQEELAAYAEMAFNDSFVKDEIEHAKAMYFICLDLESNPCGYSKLLHSVLPECINLDDAIELQRLYVDKKHVGKGIGSQLSLHSEADAIRRGFRSIWLRVWEGNDLAQKIYLNWNYTVQGMEKYRVGREERTVVLMSKKLET